MGISPDLKKAYEFYAGNNGFGFLGGILAEGLRDVLADLLEAEFQRDHETYEGRYRMYCTSCGQESNWDERHNWQRSDWQGEADRLLREL